MFDIIKNVHVDVCFCENNGGTEFCHAGHGTDKLLVNGISGMLQRVGHDIRCLGGIKEHLTRSNLP